MKVKVLLIFLVCLIVCGTNLPTARAQGGAPGPVVCVGTPQFAAQAAAPPNPAPAGRGGAPPPALPQDVTTTDIPGVVAGGLKWLQVWQGLGNNADGIVADKAGDLLVAQEDMNSVLKIDKNNQASVLISSTQGGGSLAIDRQGRIFAVERMPPANGVNANTPNAPATAAVVQLAPQK